MKRRKLSKEEQLILKAIEKGQWELVKPKKAELEHYAEAARNTFKKEYDFSKMKGRRNPYKERVTRFKTKAGALRHLVKLRKKQPAVRLTELGGTEKSLRPVPRRRP